MRNLDHPPLTAVGLTTFLDALGDSVRLDLIRQLAESDGLVCGGFDTPVSMSTLSHHLKILRTAGLVRVIPEGRFRRYELRLAECEDQFPGILRSILAQLTPRQLSPSRG